MMTMDKILQMKQKRAGNINTVYQLQGITTIVVILIKLIIR